MVRVQGKIKYASGKGYAKVDERFRTKKEADKFLKFVKGKKVKITEYKKPKRKRSGGILGTRSIWG